MPKRVLSLACLLLIPTIVAFLLLRQKSAAPPTVPEAPATSAPVAAPHEASPVLARVARNLAGQFPRHHLSGEDLDDATACRAWTNYLASFDFERVYFLGSDIARFETARLQLDDQLKVGDLDFAFDVLDTFKQRVRDRYEYVTNLVARGFDLEANESFRWKRKDLPWPRDSAEWDDIWRKKIKNEYVQQLVAKELADKPAAAPSATNAPNPAAEDDEAGGSSSPEETIRKRYKQVLDMIQDSDDDWLLERYLMAFAQAYDAHSGYMSPTSLEDFDIEMRLSLCGIGALLQAEDGAAKVVRLIPGGPADRDKRLKPGDKIVAVGQGDSAPVSVLHMPLTKTVRLIRGKKGSKVVLTVVPASDPTGDTTKLVDLIRDEVKLEEQAASSKVQPVPLSDGGTARVAVITLPAFYASMNVTASDAPGYRSSANDVAKILSDVSSQHVAGVLLDLRNNGGGSLLEAINLTGLFIQSGPVVQVRERESLRTLSDEDPRRLYAGPLLILVNRLSASASEIVAGALQDYGRAVLVGDSKTHGKGTVQTILKVGRDASLGSMRVTTAKYYRISGGSTQLRGVTPDITVSSPYDCMDIGEESLPHPMAWSEVQRAEYIKVRDLSGAIPALTAESERRRAGDSRYQAYETLLARLKARNQLDELSLNIAERRKLAKEEKELIDLQKELTPNANGVLEEKESERDLVMKEAQRILVDFARMPSSGADAQPETAR